MAGAAQRGAEDGADAAGADDADVEARAGGAGVGPVTGPFQSSEGYRSVCRESVTPSATVAVQSL